jgi:hypothetical protein
VSVDNIILHTAVQNEDLIFNDAPTAADLEMEIVSYAVIGNPAINITTGA